MSIKNAYLNEVYQGLAKRNAEQKEFLQAVEEVLESLEPVVEAHPEYPHGIAEHCGHHAGKCPRLCPR